jgi:hypothetical protein
MHKLMKNIFLSRPLWSAAALLCSSYLSSGAVSVGTSGAVVNFTTAPTDFASVTVPGASADITTIAGLDADLANAAVPFAWAGADVWTGIPDPTVVSGSGSIRYLTSGKMLSGPTGVRYSALMGQFQNNAGGALLSFNVRWTLGVPFAPSGTGAATTEQLAGIGLYFSASGAAGSWVSVHVPFASAGVAGTVNIFPGPAIAAGGQFYLAWVDENGPASTTAPDLEGNFTIDDIVISGVTVSGGPVDPPWGGPLMQPCIAVGTCFSGANASAGPNSNGDVIGLMNTNQATVQGPANNPVDMHHHPDWKRSRIGEVFGVTLDDQAAPNIFVSATAIYNSSFYPFFNQWPAGGASGDTFGTWGEPGAIYRLDGVTGAAVNYARVPNVGLPGKAQTASLGNVCFDKKRHLLYVSNLDDGNIYSVPWQSSAPVTPLVATIAFNHGTQGRAAGSLIPDDTSKVVTPAGRRVWAVQTWQDRLYYSVWNGLRPTGGTSQSGNDFTEIWSVGLNPFGTILPGTARKEVSLVKALGRGRHPVTDIAFSDAGTMMVAERGCVVATGPKQGGIINQMIDTYDPHSANIFQFTLTTSGAWGAGYGFTVGDLSTQENAAGGIDVNCDETVLATGNALALQAGFGWYGVQIIPKSLNPNGNTATNILDSYIIDFDRVSSTSAKSSIGDIAITRKACPCIRTISQQMSCRDGKQRWTVTLQNTSGFPISYMAMDNVTGGVTGLATLMPVNPALQPGQSGTYNFDFTMPTQVPGRFCFDLLIHNSDLSTCCATNFCVTPEFCVCVEGDWFKSEGPTGTRYCVRLTNFSGIPATSIRFSSAPSGSGCPYFPNPTQTISPTLQPGQTRDFCVDVVAPLSCTVLRIATSLRDSSGNPCCFSPVIREHAWGVDPDIVFEREGRSFSIRLDGMATDRSSVIESVGCMINGVESGEAVRDWPFNRAMPLNLAPGTYRVAYVIRTRYGGAIFGRERQVTVAANGVVTPVPLVIPFKLDSYVRAEDRALILVWDHPDARLETTRDLAGPWETLSGQPSPYIHSNFGPPEEGPSRRFFRLRKP